jgi:hypothetical protein
VSSPGKTLWSITRFPPKNNRHQQQLAGEVG